MGRKNNIAEGAEQKKGNVKSLKLIFQYIKPYKFYFLGVCIALTFTSSAVLGLGKGISYLVDEGFKKNDPALLDTSLIVLFCVVVLLAIATYARYFLITFLGEKVVADIRRDVFNHLMLLSQTYYENTKTGDIISRLTTDTTILQMVVGSSLSVALRNSLLLIGGLILLVTTSPKLTIYVVLIVPVVLFPITMLGRKVRKLSRHTQKQISEMSTYLEESMMGIKTIQSYCREETEGKLFANYVGNILEAAFQKTRIRALLTALVIMIVFGSIGFVLWSGGHDVLNGTISPGNLTSFIFYSVVVAGATGALSEIFSDLQRAAGATERLFEILEETPEIPELQNPKPINTLENYSMSFNIITFSYPSRPFHWALRNFKLDINEGETIALVGPSGAGKTTLINLLLRFYTEFEGDITIGGTDIKALDVKELRQLFGLVPQNPVIFSSTIRDNIAYGNTSATDQEIMRAAELAMAKSFISDLPEGINTHVGEKGVKLSGGQKQRIAIARAILKNPSILLLDEATSALDAENEGLVQKALENLMKNRTTIVIAHRLATVQKANRIVVIDSGMIHSTGTHQELMQQDGLYARLAKMQLME